MWDQLNPPTDKDLLIPKELAPNFKILVPRKTKKGNDQVWECEDVGQLTLSEQKRWIPRYSASRHFSEWDEIDSAYEDARQSEPKICAHACGGPRSRAPTRSRGPVRGRTSSFFAEEDCQSSRGCSGRQAGQQDELCCNHCSDCHHNNAPPNTHKPLTNWNDPTDRWADTVRSKYMQSLPNFVQPCAFESTCPYCVNLATNQPMMQLMEEFDSKNGKSAAATVRGPRGETANVVTTAEVPSERLPPVNELNGEEFRLWQNMTPGREHTVIVIRKALLECVPPTKNVHVSRGPSLSEWKDSYHHSSAVQVDGTDCWVAYTPSGPATHVWIEGVSVHITEQVNLTLSQSE